MIRLNFYISTTEEQFSTISNDEDGNALEKFYINDKI